MRQVFWCFNVLNGSPYFYFCDRDYSRSIGWYNCGCVCSSVIKSERGLFMPGYLRLLRSPKWISQLCLTKLTDSTSMGMLGFYIESGSPSSFGSVDSEPWIEGLSKRIFIHLVDLVTVSSLFSESLPNWLPVFTELYPYWLCMSISNLDSQTTMICMTYGTLHVHQFLQL